MPEMRFIVEWPNGREEACYSPSLVVRDYLNENVEYALSDFLERSRAALLIASDRVKAKYGHACSLALNQLQRIEATAEGFADASDPRVRCKRFVFD